MKEYKFRVWNKGMIYFGFRDIDTDDEHTLAQVTKHEGDKFSAGCIDCEESIHDVMQYTGLKDRNGKEIYEGDIVKYEGHYIGTIEFGEGEIDASDYEPCVISILGFYINNHKEYSDETASGVPRSLVEIENIRVIGNIYENPELLTKQP